MEPALRHGSGADVRLLGPAEGVRAGDIVVFRRDGRWFAHRALRSVRPGRPVPTRGDACGTPDPAVPPEAILGRLVAVRAGNRRRRLDRPAARLAGLARNAASAITRRLGAGRIGLLAGAWKV